MKVHFAGSNAFTNIGKPTQQYSTFVVHGIITMDGQYEYEISCHSFPWLYF